ncbi:MAG: response regulator transcription factor [Bacillota bacterium]
MTIRILVADDQRLMREGLATILELEEDIEVVGTVSDGLEALDACRQNPVDIILMDIRMPRLDGIEATRRILDEYPRVRIIALTTFDDEELIVRALRAGARTYLLKDLPSEKLLETVRATMRGDVLFQPKIAARLLASIPEMAEDGNDEESVSVLQFLTPREAEILRLVASGLDNREIAAELVLSEGTVKNHISTIYSKLDVRDRTQAVLWAIRHGLAPRDS